jgi:hypothetical protein
MHTGHDKIRVTHRSEGKVEMTLAVFFAPIYGEGI